MFRLKEILHNFSQALEKKTTVIPTYVGLCGFSQSVLPYLLGIIRTDPENHLPDQSH